MHFYPTGHHSSGVAGAGAAWISSWMAPAGEQALAISQEMEKEVLVSASPGVSVATATAAAAPLPSLS